MKINDRLKMIANKIPHCAVLADIGTDHAYIPIYAVLNGLCRRALASDVRAGPLKMADKNIKRYGLEKSIETRLGNGLESILSSECDVIIIAGMGGTLIRDILSTSIEKAHNAKMLLLQPNNAVDVLRKWLYVSGFDIDEELLALDAGKLYSIIEAKWTGTPVEKDEFTYYIGEKLLAGNDPLLQRYLTKKVKELEVIITGRSRSDPNKSNDAVYVTGMDTATCIDIRNRLLEYTERKEMYDDNMS